MAASAKTFRAKIERTVSRLNWLIARVPFDAGKIWGSRGPIRVTGEINGFPFKASLMPAGDGAHVLLVNKKMAKGGGVRDGTVAEIRLEPDTSKRLIVVPEELKRILAQDKALRRWFDALSYSIRKYLCDLVAGVKSAEARRRRAERVAENVLEAMEAEIELPPALRLAFSRDPRALKGWARMTPIQRRSQLLAIFYYRGHEARARRIEKVIEMAIEHYEKLLERKRASSE